MTTPGPIQPDIPIIPDEASLAAAPQPAQFLSSDETQKKRSARKKKFRELQKILVVDDEVVTRSVLHKRLAQDDYEVYMAADGRDALAQLANRDIDLVLMDISMPGFDGFSTLRFIRQKYPASKLPVIMMTSLEGRDQIIESFKNGANDYVTKPIDFDVLIARLASQLQLQSAQRDLQESEERYSLVSKGTNDGMWDWNLVTGELYLSDRWKKMVGIADGSWEPHDSDWMELIHYEDLSRVQADLESHLSGETKHFETEMRMELRTEGYRWMLCRGLAVRDEHGVAYRIAGSLTDITEGKVADSLTGLPNRVLFRERVGRSVAKYKQNPTRKFAILYMDVNDFKLINDNYGHAVGDEFLRALASRLHNALQNSDAVLARLGGDEFAVLVENINSVSDATEIAGRLCERMQIPFKLAGREFLSGVSIGISLSSDIRCTVDSMLCEADTAMYFCKRQSELPYCVFDEKMLAETSQRLELSGDLRHAIFRDEMKVFYQPIVNIHTGQVSGFEALTRWHHPVHGEILPETFISIAESTGFIYELGKWVLEQATKQLRQWNRSHRRDLSVNVNVSIRQLAVPGFVELVQDCLASNRIAASQLKLEVTESLLTQNPDQTIDLLNQLKEAGIMIAIDDFGTGYSSLAYLHQMPLGMLKVDKSFVLNMEDDEKPMAIIRSILALAQSLNLEVVAEGIETKKQYQILRSLNCDYIQGFYISPAVDASEAEKILKQDFSNLLR